MKEIRLGEVYWVNFKGDGHVQNGRRPAVVIQNNIGNKYSPTISVVPVTSQRKAKLPTHVYIKAGNYGLPYNSTVLCEGAITVNKTELGELIGCLDNDMMAQISKSCLINTPFLGFLNMSEVISLQSEAARYIC